MPLLPLPLLSKNSSLGFLIFKNKETENYVTRAGLGQSDSNQLLLFYVISLWQYGTLETFRCAILDLKVMRFKEIDVEALKPVFHAVMRKSVVWMKLLEASSTLTQSLQAWCQ